MCELKESGRYGHIFRFLFSGCFSVRAVCTFVFVGDVCGRRVAAKNCIGSVSRRKIACCRAVIATFRFFCQLCIVAVRRKSRRLTDKSKENTA